MSKLSFAPLFFLAASLSASSWAAESDHPQDLLLQMRLIDQSPSKTRLEAAGSGAKGTALVAIARDASLPPYPRLRAAGALGLFSGPEVEAALERLVVDETLAEREVRIQALRALTFVQKSRAQPHLSKLAVHPDPELRAAALRNLGRLGGSARAILARRAEVETVPWIRQLAGRELSRVSPR